MHVRRPEHLSNDHGNSGRLRLRLRCPLQPGIFSVQAQLKQSCFGAAVGLQAFGGKRWYECWPLSGFYWVFQLRVIVA